MFFKRFYDDGLAQASYLIGCERSGEAVVLDPNRDASPYVEAASTAGLRITHVAETHIHADFISGSRELAARTGGVLLLSAEGGSEWQYAFGKGDGAVFVHDGDVISIGRVRLEALHTPGHTPEHLSYLVTDGAISERPIGLVSGDFVFVGDVGRPDLLEKVAHKQGSMDAAARTLFLSLERFRALPDFVQVWPGHGAGSACGKALGAMPQSTVGYEKLVNWGVATRDEETFVRQVLDGQPDPPPYFALMKRINREGPRVLGERPALAHVDAADISEHANGILIDVRAPDLFADAHIPGALNIPAGRSFSSWAGWIVPYDRPIALVADHEADAARAARDMSFIGLDDVVGWSSYDALASWKRGGRLLAHVAQTTTSELAALIERSEVTVLDVRNDSEWEQGHVGGALHIPLGRLSMRIGEIPRSRPIVVHCQGGSRSAIAASILLANGVEEVSNLREGFDGWMRQGLPSVRDGIHS